MVRTVLDVDPLAVVLVRGDLVEGDEDDKVVRLEVGGAELDVEHHVGPVEGDLVGHEGRPADVGLCPLDEEGICKAAKIAALLTILYRVNLPAR